MAKQMGSQVHAALEDLHGRDVWLCRSVYLEQLSGWQPHRQIGLVIEVLAMAMCINKCTSGTAGSVLLQLHDARWLAGQLFLLLMVVMLIEVVVIINVVVVAAVAAVVLVVAAVFDLPLWML